jgi:choline dehydrogenase
MAYDVIVVGAGSAGVPLATRLALGGKRVLLVEAGPDYPELDDLPQDLRYGGATGTMLRTNKFHNWHFRGRASSLRPDMPVPRGKVTGGTSAINGQVILRGIPADFDGWVADGNPGWGFDDVLPYYRRIETDTDVTNDVHGADGPIPVRRYAEADLMVTQTAFREAARAAGFPDSNDHNDPTTTGVGPFPLNNPQEIRVSTAIAYLPLVRDNDGFDLLADTLVQRIVFDGTRAIGIEIEHDGEVSVIDADEIVLSAGSIGSPHLLMLSGVGPADQLASVGISVVHDLPGVGQHMEDHPAATLVWPIEEAYVVPPPAPMLQQLLRYSATDSDLPNDMWISPLTMGSNLAIVTGVHKAVSQGEIRIVSADPTVHPELDYRLLSDRWDRTRLREAVRLSIRLVESEQFAGMVGERTTPLASEVASDDALDEWMLRTVTTGHHICSTCRMGPASDPFAVVDASGRVHGITGLRVVDASIMPSIVSANTNATTMMIGEKLADAMLKGD